MKRGISAINKIIADLALNPGVECYEICANGWRQSTDSLKLFVETGEGRPFKPVANGQ